MAAPRGTPAASSTRARAACGPRTARTCDVSTVAIVWMYRGQFGKMASARTRTTSWAPGSSARSGSSSCTVARPFTRRRFGLSKSMKSRPDLRVDEQVAEALEHAVAVVAGERERRLVDHADESGPPALVRAVRAALRVGGGEEEHRPALDEGAVVVGEDAVDDLLDHAVGEPARLESILEPSRSVVVHGHLRRSRRQTVRCRNAVVRGHARSA